MTHEERQRRVLDNLRRLAESLADLVEAFEEAYKSDEPPAIGDGRESEVELIQ